LTGQAYAQIAEKKLKLLLNFTFIFYYPFKFRIFLSEKYKPYY
jgi:hypothetical protein